MLVELMERIPGVRAGMFVLFVKLLHEKREKNEELGHVRWDGDGGRRGGGGASIVHVFVS